MSVVAATGKREIGQQVPVVVIRDADRLVLIDGYLRVEALRRLHRDTALATTWPVTEVDALVRHLGYIVRNADSASEPRASLFERTPRIALSEQKRLAHLSAAAMRSRRNSTDTFNDGIATRLPDNESGRALSDGVVTCPTRNDGP